VLHPLPDKPIKFPREGNLHFPLPADYEELTWEGQREARLNACCLSRTGDPEDFVWAWAFFREEYLFPMPPGRWYDVGLVPSPPEHYEFVHAVAAHRRNIFIYPRNFAKSTLAREVQLLQLLTGIGYLGLSVHVHNDYVENSGGKLKDMLEENPYILGDFGENKPKKGQRKWSTYNLHLMNGNRWFGRSIMGKLPGSRATEIFFDDVEFDQKMRIAPSQLHEQVDRTIGGYIIPMMRGGHGRFHMVGTFHTRKFFVYHAATAKPEEDDRFVKYHKIMLGVEDDQGARLWEDWYDDDFLEEVRQELSAEEYGSQYMNRPGTGKQRVIQLHPELSYYVVPNPDEAYVIDPLNSEADLVTWRPTPDADLSGSRPKTEKIVRPFGETVSNMYRLLVADPIREPSWKSDLACVMVVGIEHSEHFKDTWYYLDMRMDRCSDSTFMDWIWELGLKWQVRVCGIEAVSTQQKLVERIAGDFADRAVRAGWAPKIYPIRYDAEFGHAKRESKGKRIGRVVWRYEQHRMKLPRHLVRRGPPWSTFRQQLDDFTESLDLLPFDDAIDCSVMPAFMVRPRGNFPQPTSKQVAGDIFQMMRNGTWHDPTTHQPLLAACSMQDLPPDIVELMQTRRFEAQERREKEKARRTGHRRPGPPLRGRRMMNYA
jgi:hypothetical protein